ncbi:MAG: YaeQ family protein [Halodesulfovibrio sp.]
MKYTLNITRKMLAPDARDARDASEMRTKLVLRAAPGEVAWHIALKVLGYLLFMEYEPRIEEGIGWHYKPDLVSLDAEGRLRLWVDCGNIAVRKIDRVAQKVGADVPFIILRRTQRDAQLLAQSLDKMRFPERVHILSFDKGFVDALAEALDATNHIRADIGPRPETRSDVPSDKRLYKNSGEHLKHRAEHRQGASTAFDTETDGTSRTIGTDMAGATGMTSATGKTGAVPPTVSQLRHITLHLENRKGDSALTSAITLQQP